MASAAQNLSSYNPDELGDAASYSFGIVVASWNREITDALYNGCYETLVQQGAHPNNIITLQVPGSFELVSGGQALVQQRQVDAVICLGCVIKGETRHDEYISHAVGQGLIDLTLKYEIPFIFGVLTTNNLEQAKERSGGKYGNKGVEAAATAIYMAGIDLQIKLV